MVSKCPLRQCSLTRPSLLTSLSQARSNSSDCPGLDSCSFWSNHFAIQVLLLDLKMLQRWGCHRHFAHTMSSHTELCSIRVAAVLL